MRISNKTSTCWAKRIQMDRWYPAVPIARRQLKRKMVETLAKSGNKSDEQESIERIPEFYNVPRAVKNGTI